jgi:hypothetical protein
MRQSLLVWGLVLLMACAHAQSVAWSRLYLHANSRGFLPQVAAADPQGNLIVAGRYIHQDTAFNSVAIVKYALNGDLLWMRTFGELREAEYAEAIAVAPDGSFYLGITRANRDSLAFLQRWSAERRFSSGQRRLISAHTMSFARFLCVLTVVQKCCIVSEAAG